MASPRRIARTTLALVAAAAVACSSSAPAPPAAGPSPAGPTAAPTVDPDRPLGPYEQIACGLPPRELTRIRNGYLAGRSGQIQIVPKRPNFIGAWLSHSGPWEYVQGVPLIFYGPGRVPEGVRVPRPVTSADIAPTLARYLGFPFEAPDGEALEEAVIPGQDPPKLIVVMIWDSAGRNVLAEHRGAWPFLRSLAERGTSFERAAVGSSPSVTPAIHATIGTGAFPRTHGVMDLRYTVDGAFTGARGQAARHLLVPSLGDLYDLAMGNEPLLGLVGSEGTLGMMSRGAFQEGGDRDLAVTRTFTDWFLEGANAELFDFASYATDYPGLEEAVAELDREDGALDGRWMGEPIGEGNEGLSATPAFSVYQSSLLREVIVREGFGADDVPDLLFTNFREIDAAGHTWSMNSEQMATVVGATDEALRKLATLLDARVGEGEWVLAVTADHGATPRPEETGAFVINPGDLKEDLAAAFDGDGDDRPVIQDFRVTQVWLDLEELAENGHTIQDVTAFMADYSQAQNVPDPSALPAGAREDRVFRAVFPSAVLDGLPCLEP